MQKIIDSLTDALFLGLSETPRWKTFLDGLRQVTGAHLAIFQCHPPGGEFSRAIYRISGQVDMPGNEEELFRHWMSLAPPPSHLVKEGRPFDVLSAYRREPPLLDKALGQEFDKYRLTALRALRVIERSGVEAWLFVTRSSGDLHPSTDAVLEAIAPVLRGVAEFYVTLEQERYRATLGMQSALRATKGWLTLDASARVIEYDDNCAQVLASTSVLQIMPDGKLKIEPPNVENRVRQIVRKFEEGSGDQQVIRLSRRPWIEITLQPARRTPVSTKTPAAALMHLNHDMSQSHDWQGDLARNLGLSQREAELSMALGRGSRVSEAAEDMGLTVNTARAYLRSIYSKTGASGLPDLVRLVNRSLSTQHY